MDLRVQRTKNNIINAFIELRSKKPLEKISVKELSELAFINKATFYTHYRDIYDLAEQLENEAIDTVLNSISHPECLVTNPKQGVRSLSAAIRSQNELFSILFAPPRNVVLLNKIETALRARIFGIFPEFQNNLEMELLLTVLIHGCFTAFVSHHDADPDTVIEILGKFNECLIHTVYSKPDLSQSLQKFSN